jgi:hypothetical protein
MSDFDVTGYESYSDSERGMRPTASIRASGQAGINHGAITHYGLNERTEWFVVIYYSSETRKVAIHILPDGAAEGLKLRITKQNDIYTGTISARSFFDKYAIPYEGTTQRFYLERHTLKGTPILVFDLSRPLRSTVSGRKQKEETE